MTPWEQILEGKLIQAVYDMYNIAFDGWVIAILFFVFQFILFVKTRNINIMYVLGTIFLALFSYTTYIKETSLSVMFVVLVLELAGIMFAWFFKR